MNVIQEELENGLSLVIIPMPSVQSATITVWVRTGSRFEDPKVSGISHFMEHMVFKGSKKYPTAKETAIAIESLGADFNAATSHEWTNFYIKARAGVLPTAFDVLSDMLIDPLLSNEEIEREKGVILEEMAMNEDNPMRKVHQLFVSQTFEGTSLERRVLGSKKTVKNVRREDFVDYRDNFYYPENMLITVAGGVERDVVKHLADEHFAKIKDGDKEPQEAFEEYDQKEPRVVIKNKDTDQTHIAYGYRGLPRDDERRYAESILVTLLGQGMSSRMFLEVRERKGLAYAIGTGGSHYMDTGYVQTYAGLQTVKAKEAVELIKEIHEEVKEEGTIEEAELNKAKESIKGRLALSLEDTEEVNEFIGIEKLFLDKIRTPEDIYKKIDAVKIKDVHEVAQEIFNPDRLNLAVVGPFEDEKEFKEAIS